MYLSEDGMNVIQTDVDDCRQEFSERRAWLENYHLKNFQESAADTRHGAHVDKHWSNYSDS